MVLTLPRPPVHLLHGLIGRVPINNPHVQRLDERIHQFHKEQMQTNEMMEERNECLNLIRKYLESDGIKNQIESQGIRINALTVFGSFATHCAGKDSDLDVCVCASFQGKKKTLPVTVLQAIHRDLEHNRESKKFFGSHKIHEISFVQTARIPIIRFKMNNISVDMSASFNSSPPLTSLAAKYINAYCQLDERFKVLVTFLKHWLKSEGNPNTHLRDYPNSYSLILMLIHVLQWFDILPNLHQTHSELFHSKYFKSWSLTEVDHEFRNPLDQNTIEMHRRKETRKYSVVQLLFLFACQYSETNIMMFYRFNMRSGEIEGRTMPQPITIVDAYDTRNPGRTVQNVYDLMGALKALIDIVVQPHHEMFQNILRVTIEKKYLQENNHPVYIQPALPLTIQVRPQNNQHRVQSQQPSYMQGFGNFLMQQQMFPMHPNFPPAWQHNNPVNQGVAFGQFPFPHPQIRPQ